MNKIEVDLERLFEDLDHGNLLGEFLQFVSNREILNVVIKGDNNLYKCFIAGNQNLTTEMLLELIENSDKKTRLRVLFVQKKLDEKVLMKLTELSESSEELVKIISHNNATENVIRASFDKAKDSPEKFPYVGNIYQEVASAKNAPNDILDWLARKGFFVEKVVENKNTSADTLLWIVKTRVYDNLLYKILNHPNANVEVMQAVKSYIY